MDVRAFLDSAPYEEIRDTIAALATKNDPQAVADLKGFLLHRDSNTYFKHAVPRLACLALLQKGAAGVEALTDVLPNAPGSIYPTSILEALWHASHGRTPTGTLLALLPPGAPLDGPLPAGTAQAAGAAIRNFVADSIENEDHFDHLIQFLWQENISANTTGDEQARHDFRTHIFDLLTAGRIRLTDRLLVEFDALVNASQREEAYQQFLTLNPVFLDPLATQIIPKQRLGIEHITDFVLRRLDDQYILVEIEKPQDEIFTGGDDFSAKFTHALGQVLDFQQWIDTHSEYARTLLPRISSPRGLLVMGRFSALTNPQKVKLHRFNVNSATIQVLTFDDVAQNARRLHENIYERTRTAA
jgi:Domain of unknown function (DUF4263)